MQQNIREYIFLVNSEVWRVYGHNEKEAKHNFIEVCRKYSDTKDEVSRKYWTKLHNQVLEGDYIQTINDDFNCVRKITG